MSSTSYVSFVSALEDVYIHKSLGKAMIGTNWRQLLVEQKTTLHSNNTPDISSLPLDKTTMGYRWVYIVKVRPYG